MRPLTAITIYSISQLMERLRLVKSYDLVIFEDGQQEKYNQKLIIASMRELASELQSQELATADARALAALTNDFQNKYIKPKGNIEEPDARRLVTLVERLEAAVKQEIVRRNFSEIILAEGALDYNGLLTEGLVRFLGGAAWQLPALVKKDLDEAIRCLSYGAPTASVMIGLRAVEGMLRQVHSKLTGDDSKRTWKPLLDGIQEELKEKGVADSPLFGYLDYVRGVRNQADHPDRTFSQPDAEQLFMHAIHIIREVEKLGATIPAKK